MAIVDWFLIGAACITSMIAAIGGVGGGVVLIAIMPGFLPAAAIIPVHGLVQIAALGSRFIADIEWETMPLFLGIFILLITWIPKFSRTPDLPAKFTLLGAFQTALSLFFGVSGPLNMPFLLRENLPRDRTVITHSVQMASSHAMKILTYGFLGFVFAPYWKLVIGMIASASLGSYLGTLIRGRVPEHHFRVLLKWLITLLALRMILYVLFSTS